MVIAATEAPVETGPSELDLRMQDIDPDQLSPREALDVLYSLKALAKPGEE